MPQIASTLLSSMICVAIIAMAVVIIRMVYRRNVAIRQSIRGKSDDETERVVEWELAKAFYQRGYIIFSNLIIPSVSKTIASTQIDHVIVSQYGIFCLETKSHQGNIYGGMQRWNWKQYLGPNSYNFHSPVQQNDHHVRSLEHLLRVALKAPVHSYLVFPYANRIKIDGREKDMSIEMTIRRILLHDRVIYTPDEMGRIAKALVYVSEKTGEFEEDHIKSVQCSIATKTR